MLLSCKITSPSLTMGEYHHVSVVTGGGNGPSNGQDLIAAAKEDILKRCPGSKTESILKTVSLSYGYPRINIWYGSSFEISNPNFLDQEESPSITPPTPKAEPISEKYGKNVSASTIYFIDAWINNKSGITKCVDNTFDDKPVLEVTNYQGGTGFFYGSDDINAVKRFICN